MKRPKRKSLSLSEMLISRYCTHRLDGSKAYGKFTTEKPSVDAETLLLARLAMPIAVELVGESKFDDFRHDINVEPPDVEVAMREGIHPATVARQRERRMTELAQRLRARVLLYYLSQGERAIIDATTCRLLRAKDEAYLVSLEGHQASFPALPPMERLVEFVKTAEQNLKHENQKRYFSCWCDATACYVDLCVLAKDVQAAFDLAHCQQQPTVWDVTGQKPVQLSPDRRSAA